MFFLQTGLSVGKYIPRMLFVYDRKSPRRGRLVDIARGLFDAGLKASWAPIDRLDQIKISNHDIIIAEQDCELPDTKLMVVRDIYREISPEIAETSHGFLIEHTGQKVFVSEFQQPHRVLPAYAAFYPSVEPHIPRSIGVLPAVVTPEHIPLIEHVINTVRSQRDVSIVVPESLSYLASRYDDSVYADDITISLSASLIDIGLVFAQGHESRYSFFPLLTHASCATAVVASKFYRSHVRSASMGAIASTEEEWVTETLKLVDSASRRARVGTALYEGLYRYNINNVATVAAPTISDIYRTILGVFKNTKSA